MMGAKMGKVNLEYTYDDEKDTVTINNVEYVRKEEAKEWWKIPGMVENYNFHSSNWIDDEAPDDNVLVEIKPNGHALVKWCDSHILVRKKR